MVTKEQIEKYSTSNAQAESVNLRTMYFGTGSDALLAIINKYENASQNTLRKKHLITNEYVTEDLLRPVDNIWGARGGSTYYGVNDTQRQDFILKLKNVRPGVSLSNFMRDIWFERFITDPNGLIFLEIKDKEPVLTYKSIDSIEAYKKTGLRVDWVLFTPHRKNEQGEDISWFVDGEKYVEVIHRDNGFIEGEEIKNTFGFVPAIINSSIFSTETQMFISPIKKQLGLLRSYLTKNSVKEIYQFLHLYPIFWQYENLCPSCNGLRTINDKVCGVCNGTGFAVNKDVSDVIVLQKPNEDSPAVTPPAGYVQPDIATMGEQRTELEWLFEKLFHSHWGTTIEKGSNETATGRFIDVQPVNNKLESYAAIAEVVEGKIIDLFGKFYYPETYKESIVTYGRRFLVESPDIILKKYNEAKGKSPVKVLDMLLEQFYYSEYQNDQEKIEYYLKIMELEPYVHRTIEDVESLAISDTIKQSKRLFPQWQKTVTIPYVVVTPITTLNKLLIKFSEDESTEVQQILPEED